MTLVNTDYSIALLWRSRIVSGSLIIPMGFDSSPVHKISNYGSPLTSSIYIDTCFQPVFGETLAIFHRSGN